MNTQKMLLLTAFAIRQQRNNAYSKSSQGKTKKVKRSLEQVSKQAIQFLSYIIPCKISQHANQNFSPGSHFKDGRWGGGGEAGFGGEGAGGECSGCRRHTDSSRGAGRRWTLYQGHPQRQGETQP